MGLSFVIDKESALTGLDSSSIMTNKKLFNGSLLDLSKKILHKGDKISPLGGMYIWDEFAILVLDLYHFMSNVIVSYIYFFL